MEDQQLLPHLFRTEYRKIISVLSYTFGIGHIETAEDIVSDTFLAATELWSLKGIPENPVAWLYTVAKNKTKNHLKRDALFSNKLAAELKHSSQKVEEMEIDLSEKNINDSQLAMIFTVCNPCISDEAQIALALNLLCGFGIQEIANAFLTNKEVIYKRIQRSREKLRTEGIQIQQPSPHEITHRLPIVLKTIYLLFSEGYYSSSHDSVLRKDLCTEAMRLNVLLIDNPITNLPAVNALLSLICFHSSRFDARTNANGELILYEDQDETLWDRKLIDSGIRFLNLAAAGDQLTKYHLEAGIAYWHTQKEDSEEKWESILQLYNSLLILEYSPIAALNRTYALAKTNGKAEAILQAEKLDLTNNHFYFSLLGHLYTDLDNTKAFEHFETALRLAVSSADKTILSRNILRLTNQ